MNDEIISKAVRDLLAKEVLAGITNEAREALLHNSIVKAMESWEFRNTVAKAVGLEADKIADNMIRSEQWQTKITLAVQEGLQSFLAKLPKAVETSLIEMFAGQDGKDVYARRPGQIIKHL